MIVLKGIYKWVNNAANRVFILKDRAIIANPKLLLADEPTGNLNSKQGEEIMELFKKLYKEGVTIIQVTHSEKNAGYGNRVIELLDGMIVNH